MNARSSGRTERRGIAITLHQIAAIVSPHLRTSDLIGNFADFENLFSQLGEPGLIPLGQPLPREKFLPKKRVGSCPAAHNRLLLDEPEDG
jgi:hypothetical protein